MAAGRLSGGRLWFRTLQVVALAIVAALIALLGWRVAEANRGPNLASNVRAGKRPQAPEFTLSIMWPEAGTWPAEVRPALADGELSLSELRGYPVVLNFWASWCIPCKEEAPILGASAREHAGRVVFVGIDVQDFRSDGLRFLERYAVNYVSVQDDADSTYSAYGLTGVPETYYLDAGGRAVEHAPGAVSREELDAGIAEAIGAER